MFLYYKYFLYYNFIEWQCLCYFYIHIFVFSFSPKKHIHFLLVTLS